MHCFQVELEFENVGFCTKFVSVKHFSLYSKELEINLYHKEVCQLLLWKATWFLWFSGDRG